MISMVFGVNAGMEVEAARNCDVVVVILDSAFAASLLLPPLRPLSSELLLPSSAISCFCVFTVPPPSTSKPGCAATICPSGAISNLYVYVCMRVSGGFQVSDYFGITKQGICCFYYSVVLHIFKLKSAVAFTILLRKNTHNYSTVGNTTEEFT